MKQPFIFRVSPAKNFRQILEAYHVAYMQYCKYGLMQPHINQLRFFLRELLPNAMTFVAKSNNQVVGTITGLLRGTTGLPSDKTFSDIYKQHGLFHREVAEATKLACLPVVHDSPRGFGDRSIVVCELLRWVFWWYEYMRVDDWIAAIHPDHKALWEQELGFTFLAELDSYGYVKDNPCLLLRLDMRALRTGKQKPTETVERYILDRPIDQEAFRQAYSIPEREIMLLLLEHQDLISQCETSELKSLRAHYPLAVNCAERLLELEQKIKRNKNLISIIDTFQETLSTTEVRSKNTHEESTSFSFRELLRAMTEVLEVSATLDRKRFSCEIQDTVTDALIGEPVKLANLITELSQILLTMSDAGERISLHITSRSDTIQSVLLQLTFHAPIISKDNFSLNALPEKLSKKCQLRTKDHEKIILATEFLMADTSNKKRTDNFTYNGERNIEYDARSSSAL